MGTTAWVGTPCDLDQGPGGGRRRAIFLPVLCLFCYFFFLEERGDGDDESVARLLGEEF